MLTDTPARSPQTYWGRTTLCCRPRGPLCTRLEDCGRVGRLAGAFVRALLLVRNRSRCRAAVVASSPTGNTFALVQSLLPFGRLPTVMFDCLWYVPKHPLLRRLKSLQLRLEARSVYRFVVWSKHEVRDYALAFGIPEDKFVFIPFHTTLIGYDYSVNPGDYVFAGGNGDRDYATLVRAVRGLEVPVVVATSDWAAFRGEPIPPNMTVRPCSHAEFRELMAGAAVVVVPMEKGHLHSGGQQTYLNAMAMGKPVVVCDPRGTTGYIENGLDGVVLDYGDSEGLRQAIVALVSEPDRAAAIGQAARRRIESGPYSTEACMRAVVALAYEAAESAEPCGNAADGGQTGRGRAKR
ncbi:MAG: glycosyltransferase family 4 protein [Armatimonadota bacterium]